jgi:hypothetical protein
MSSDKVSDKSTGSYDESKYVLSVDDTDLIVYKNIDRVDNKKKNATKIKYVCKRCIDLTSKRTKRLLHAIKKRSGLNIKFVPTSDEELVMKVIHPLYDPDVYTLYEESVVARYDLEVSDKVKQDSKTDTESEKKPLFYVYVLELEQDKYYVGRSSKPLNRTGEHLVSTLFSDSKMSGSGWTGMYHPLRILDVDTAYDEFDEDRFTLKYMKEKGIDNVRGGSFCELNLSRENVVTLEKMLAGAEDRCYYCGADDHYISDCPQKNFRRVAKKSKKQMMIKPKDIPKSKIMKFYGATKLLENSQIDLNKIKKSNITNQRLHKNTVNEDSDSNNDKNNEREHNKNEDDKDHNDTIKNVSGDKSECKNPETTNKNNQTIKPPTPSSGSKTNTVNGPSYVCRFCDKLLPTKQKLEYHEKITCSKSFIAQRGKKVDADVDAILEKNKKFTK